MVHLRGAVAAGLIAIATGLLGSEVHADCIAKAFRAGEVPDNPIYRVMSCGSAERVVEQRREENPTWYGTFVYAENDVVLTVVAANEDARNLMWEDSEHWYFASGCEEVEIGTTIERPRLSELCCDVGPVSSLPCGVGGKTLLKLP